MFTECSTEAEIILMLKGKIMTKLEELIRRKHLKEQLIELTKGEIRELRKEIVKLFKSSPGHGDPENEKG